MPKIFDALYRSEKIVKSIGNATLIDGRTLSESLIIDGIPYWDVFASELASRYVPSAFAELTFSETINQLIKPLLVRIKYFIRDFARIHKNCNQYKDKSLSGHILCLEFMPQQSRDVMQPVISYLLKQKNVQIMSLRDKEWLSNIEILNSNELRATIWSFWNNQLSIKADILKKQSKLINKIFLKSKILEQVGSISDLALKKRIQKILNRLFIGEMSSLIRQGVIAKYILENHRPSLVMVTDVHDPRTRLYLLQCKNLNIPYLAIQHGLTNLTGTEWRFFSADRIAVWGSYSKEILISHGIDPKKIFLTGPPRSDLLLATRDFETKALKNKLGIPEISRVILLASTFVLESYDGLNDDAEILKAMKRAIFNSVERLENTYLIVKLHPHERENETRSLILNDTNIIFVDKEEDIRPLTKICDCFVAFNSTTTLDAILLNKLVVCPAFPGWIWNNTYADTHAVYTPVSAEEIRNIFNFVSTSDHIKLINKVKSARDKLISSWVYRYDGKCSQRVGNLALSMRS